MIDPSTSPSEEMWNSLFHPGSELEQASHHITTLSNPTEKPKDPDDRFQLVDPSSKGSETLMNPSSKGPETYGSTLKYSLDNPLNRLLYAFEFGLILDEVEQSTAKQATQTLQGWLEVTIIPKIKLGRIKYDSYERMKCSFCGFWKRQNNNHPKKEEVGKKILENLAKRTTCGKILENILENPSIVPERTKAREREHSRRHEHRGTSDRGYRSHEHRRDYKRYRDEDRGNYESKHARDLSSTRSKRPMDNDLRRPWDGTLC